MFIIRSTKPCSIAKYTAYIIIHNFTILTIPFINALPIIDFLFYIKLTITITYTHILLYILHYIKTCTLLYVYSLIIM